MTGFLVAGTASGVGKTTVTMALIAAMRARGMTVQAFKGGPDFLDAGHLTRVSGRAARNVDTWMLSAEANRALVRSAAGGADAVVAEGMMGLFDGKDAETERGSSAEIAKILRLPVVLVVDAGKSARSVAAVVLGFETFDPEMELAGVVLNRVASERHYGMLAAAIAARCRTPVLGWMGREPLIAVAERHLGLRTAEEDGAEAVEARSRVMAATAERTLDMERVLRLGVGTSLLAEDPAATSLREGGAGLAMAARAGERVRIGVARDVAFSFYYEDNLDLLRAEGAELVEFRPTEDVELPRDLDAMYLGGGYPEMYAGQLSGNAGMRRAVREFAEAGGVVYAECGGMMYLGRELVTADGERYAMAGVLPTVTEMTARLVKFGYVTVTATRDCLLGPKGTEVRGHSFHYSRMRVAEGDEVVETAYRVRYSLSGAEEEEGLVRGEVLASYAHLHFGACPGVAANFVARARAARHRRLVTA